MKQPQKTIDIAVFKERFNNLLKKDEISEESKKDVCLLLEDILHKTQNYNGFQNLDWINGGRVAWDNAGKPENKNEFHGREFTRKYY